MAGMSIAWQHLCSAARTYRELTLGIDKAYKKVTGISRHDKESPVYGVSIGVDVGPHPVLGKEGG